MGLEGYLGLEENLGLVGYLELTGLWYGLVGKLVLFGLG